MLWFPTHVYNETQHSGFFLFEQVTLVYFDQYIFFLTQVIFILLSCLFYFFLSPVMPIYQFVYVHMTNLDMSYLCDATNFNNIPMFSHVYLYEVYII